MISYACYKILVHDAIKSSGIRTKPLPQRRFRNQHPPPRQKHPWHRQHKRLAR
ncbi:hypothetical protein BC940DRAFT_290312 [Gongronella butleri]|nr:hypothetical protein BC940DRAFT_290312 [Gongronella butleri]